MGIRTVLSTPLLREGTPSELFIFADERSVPSLTGKLNCLKPSPTKP